MKSLFTLLFALGFLVGFGQTSLRLHVENIPVQNSKKVFLEAFEKDQWQILANSDLDVSGNVNLTLDPSHIGQYRLRFSGTGKPWTDFYINPKTLPKSIDFTVDFSTLKGLPSSLFASSEQADYVELSTLYSNLQLEYDSYKSITHPAFLNKQKTINNNALEKAEEVAKSEVYANLAPLFSRRLPQDFVQFDSTMYFKHFLGNVDYNNEVILFHYAFIRGLNQYFNQLYKAYPKEYAQKFTDELLGRMGENEAVNQFLHNFILIKMLDYKNEDGLSYYLNNYADGCSDDASFSITTKNLIESLKNCSPGKKATELKYPNSEGKLISLEETCKKNKITLIMFWRSNCSHCEEFHPQLQEIYKKYHEKGFEVYAISIDKEEAPWKNHLLTHEQPWINVLPPMDKRPFLAKHYPAPSTPTLIALDSNMKVISRLIMRSKLENFLEENKAYFE
jgi:thiol-disulfide isomerase/thioredoxin